MLLVKTLFRLCSTTLFLKSNLNRKMAQVFFSLILLFMGFMMIFVSCSGRSQHVTSTSVSSDSVMVEYARGFTIEKQGDITVLTVSNPWQGAQNVVYRYVLCPKGKKIPAEYAQYTAIYTPVERVICLTTKQIAMLAALGKTSSIKGLSNVAFVSDSLVRRAIADGQIADIGYDQGLNYEKIISLKPDVIFAYGVGEEVVGSTARLADLGQKIVFIAEYLERTALGQAEWIKFMAAFFDCEEQAVQKFDAIRDEYESLRKLAENRKHHPKILCGLPWQGIWHVPGGKTWMAAMIADAGGEYLWKDNSFHESFPVNIETVVNQSVTADLWINTDAARTLGEITSVDERLSLVKPFRRGMVYNNCNRLNVSGGNDFFESGVVNPHIILKDMIRIFHPDLLPDHQFFYYMKLE